MPGFCKHCGAQLQEGDKFCERRADSELKSQGYNPIVTPLRVTRNGEVETRKRAKITAGEVIVFENFEIFVEGWDRFVL